MAKIDKTGEYAVKTELDKIKSYARLLSWDLTISDIDWTNKTSYEVILQGSRNRVPLCVMVQPKIKPAKPKKKRQSLREIVAKHRRAS